MNNSQNQAKEYYNNGIQLYLSKLYDRALEKFDQAIDSDWLFLFAHLWKAKTLIKLKKYMLIRLFPYYIFCKFQL